MFEWLTRLVQGARGPARRWSSTNPADWVLTANTTSSGIRVTPDNALTLAAVWRAVDMISTDVAKLPLHVYRRVGAAGAGKERATLHPAYKLIRRAPDGHTPAFYFWKNIIKDCLLRGNGYAYVFRNSLGSPVELMLLPAACTYPVVETSDLGRRLYYVTTATGSMRRLDPADMLHVRGMGYDGIQGYSVVGHAADGIGGAMQADRYARVFFSNSTGGRVVLEAPDAMPQEAQQNLVESWERAHSGMSNVGKTAVLEQGVTAKVLNMSSQDAELLGSRQWETKQIANWFGIPPSKLGIADVGTSYNSLEQEEQAYLSGTLDSWLCATEQEATLKLISERDRTRDESWIEFSRNALARADMSARSAYYNTAIMGGWMSRDEVRGLENYNPIPGGAGAVFLEPLNMQGAGQDPEPPAEPEPEPEPPTDPPASQADEDEELSATGRAVRKLTAAIVTRHHHRILEQAAKAARKPDGWLDWVADGLARRNAGILRRDLAAVVDVWQVDPVVAATVVDRTVSGFMGRMRAELDNLADHLPAELPGAVAALQAAGPAAVIANTLDEMGGGQ